MGSASGSSFGTVIHGSLGQRQDAEADRAGQGTSACSTVGWQGMT